MAALRVASPMGKTRYFTWGEAFGEGGDGNPIRRSPGGGPHLAQPFFWAQIRFYTLGGRVSLTHSRGTVPPKTTCRSFCAPEDFLADWYLPIRSPDGH